MDYSNNRCGCMQRPHLPEPPHTNTGNSCGSVNQRMAGNSGGCDDNRPMGSSGGCLGNRPTSSSCGCAAQRPMQPDMPCQQMPAQNRNSASPAERPSCSLRQPDRENTQRDCLSDMSVAMAYVPMQRWNQVYDMSRGLTRGTIFPELDLPFVMGRCR